MSIDGLSDSELRTKLMEYGYPVGPVTHTTRKILVKKLKTLINARETNRGTWSRHSLARYSSEDTDDDTSSTTSKKKKPSASTRRQTLANPMPPPPPAPADKRLSKSPVKEKVSEHVQGPVTPPRPLDPMDYAETPAPWVTTRPHGKAGKKYNKKSLGANDGLETGSDSDIVEEVNKTYSDAKYSKPRSVHTIKDNKYTKLGLSTNVTSLPPEEDNTYTQDNTQRDLLANYETPFLSEFTKRLSSQASLPSPSNLKNLTMRYSTSNTPELKEKDSNGHFSSLRKLYSSAGPSARYAASLDRTREAMSRGFKQPSREDARNNQNMVSGILVVVLGLFFCVLGVIYMGLGGKTDTFPSLSTDSNIPLCFLGADLKTPGVNCIMKENVESVLHLLKRLQPILLRKAVAAKCDDTGEIPYLTDTDIIQMFTSNKVTSLEVKEDLVGAQFLVIKNSQWGISVIDYSEDTNGAEYEIVDSQSKLFSTRLNGKVGMINLNPELPLQCHIKNKLFTIFSSLLIVALGLLAVIGIQKFFVWYIRYKKCTEREVFKLVSEIINMVETHHQNTGMASPGGTQETFLAINHVRDNLIPPIDRKKMSGLWEKAVKFLDENESRIRREVQQVAGEEFHVWRWLPNNTLNKSNAPSPSVSKKSKVWQGQAFETMEGSVNSPTCSPTPCLKIRHMFDPDVEFEDDWETKVHDAILEKCGEGVKILHIRVNRESREGCVYMKCLSQEDAGKAYRALHGWWFDGQLVTVTYLRLERYHERFPAAICCTTPLKPSNNQRLSMQAHYWQSPLEAN